MRKILVSMSMLLVIVFNSSPAYSWLAAAKGTNLYGGTLIFSPRPGAAFINVGMALLCVATLPICLINIKEYKKGKMSPEVFEQYLSDQNYESGAIQRIVADQNILDRNLGEEGIDRLVFSAKDDDEVTIGQVLRKYHPGASDVFVEFYSEFGR